MNVDYVRLNKLQSISESDTFTAERYAQFHKYFDTAAKKILDVGCNTGRGGKILKAKNKNLEIFGLDCVQERLEQLPEHIYTGYSCSFSNNIDSPDDTYDVVVAGEFIEHLTFSDAAETLKEFRRVLRPNGMALLTTPNPGYVKLLLTRGSVIGGAHLSLHYPKQLKAQMEEVGFLDVTYRGSGKVSRLIGDNFPFVSLYGSYLISGRKN